MRSTKPVSALVFLSFLASCSATAISPSSGELPSSLAPSGSNNPQDKYRRSHSLPEGYNFDRKDGWEHVNVTDMKYKYAARARDTAPLASLFDKPRDDAAPRQLQRRSTDISLGGTITHLINDVWNALKGTGKPEDVTITWYTGHDLDNPSCWANTAWTPTDNSFACAVTLEGWTTRPKCFKFIELCNGPKKCVFVRVIDSCAGCAKGSKHVDLTKSAFSQLANINEGVLTVQMRSATDPDDWYEELWGPKAN